MLAYILRRLLLIVPTLLGILVTRIKSVHQAIAEGIGVDVEGRVDEMRDVAPEGAVILIELESRAEAFLLHAQPDLAQAIRRQFALAARGMHLALELEEGDLANDGIDHVLDLGGQHDPAPFRSRLIEQGAEGQLLAEDRRRLGQGKRRIRHQRPLLGRQQLMHAMAQLMGKRHHVARAALIVQQQIRMGAGHRRMREGTRGLAGPRRRIDPGIVEEFAPQVGKLRRKAAISLEHDVARLVPADHAVLVFRQGRVAIPPGQLLGPHPLGLQLVIAMRQPRIGSRDRVGERVDDFRFDAIRQMAIGFRRRIPAPAILDLLVLGQRIGDQREETDILAEHLGERLRRCLADLRITIGELVQYLFGGELVLAERKTQARHGFVEQAAPGGTAGHGLLMQELLDLVAELMLTEQPQITQPGPVMRQLGRFR